MEKSRQEIIKQCGELVDLVGDLYDENEKNWRRYCNESRKRNEVEKELADRNFKIEKVIRYIKNGKEDNWNIDVNDILDILKGEDNE